jgi:N-acetylmuramoyl-L-alanine amidase
MSEGKDIVAVARAHLTEHYVFGAKVPKDNEKWKGPWDCAEFASWCVFQVAHQLYGCDRDAGNPATVDAYTGYWARDVKKLGRKITIAEAAATPGAFLLRVAQGDVPGHIAISDGRGGTVEAHSAKDGVVALKVAARRWDCGVLVPGIDYAALSEPQVVETPPPTLHLKKPPLTGKRVAQVQRVLKRRGYDPGWVDGIYGPHTVAAVIAYQLTKGLAPDGEVGPETLQALGIASPTMLSDAFNQASAQS